MSKYPHFCAIYRAVYPDEVLAGVLILAAPISNFTTPHPISCHNCIPLLLLSGASTEGIIPLRRIM